MLTPRQKVNLMRRLVRVCRDYNVTIQENNGALSVGGIRLMKITENGAVMLDSRKDQVMGTIQ